jgi:5'(3')-deoxyribonucleotidase
MNKAHFLLFVSTILFLSCAEKKESTSEQSIEKINTISVLIDDQLWKGEIGDSIRNKFASPVIGLPQEEPLFTINQYPVKLLEGYRTTSRNIIVIKKERKSKFEITENEFTKPQNIVRISGKTGIEIIDTLEKHSSQIIRMMKKSEIIENQRNIFKALANTKKITKKFQVKINVPKGFNYVIIRKKFMWLKKEIPSGSMSLLMYQLPINNIVNTTRSNTINNIIRTRDSIGNLYIHGRGKNTRMITEVAYTPYFSTLKIDNKKTFESKGTWELKNDFMSGPFINYCIIDKRRNRILVLEGFCYAPSKEKRDIMFELEAIIKSTNFK